MKRVLNGPFIANQYNHADESEEIGSGRRTHGRSCRETVHNSNRLRKYYTCDIQQELLKQLESQQFMLYSAH